MNFSRLSRSSVRSSSSSSKSLYQSEELTKLENIIETLQQNNESLKKTVENKDIAITILSRDKEKLYEELKCAQRTNRNLYQQLSDERDIHFKEKEYLLQDIQRLSYTRESHLNLNTRREEEKVYAALEDEIQEKDGIICNICSKYLKVKSSKMSLQKKIVKLQKQSQKMCNNIVSILQENRQALDVVLNRLLKMSHISKSGKKIITLLKINARLHYENTQLKIRMTSENEDYNKGNSNRPNFESHKYSKQEEKDVIVRKLKNTALRRTMSTNAAFFIRRSEEMRKFRSLHSSLSPHLHKETHRSKSDTNLVCLK